jgi:hypothetical protein
LRDVAALEEEKWEIELRKELARKRGEDPSKPKLTKHQQEVRSFHVQGRPRRVANDKRIILLSTQAVVRIIISDAFSVFSAVG